MGRAPCCDKNGLKKGPWTPEEDEKLIHYIQKHGYGNWRTLPKNAGLQRCGKSCRLRWTNYLRPDIKRGRFSPQEEETIIQLHSVLGNKWSAIAGRLPGRTDNEIKNYWNTHIRKSLLRMGIDPVTHAPLLDLMDLSTLILGNSSQMNFSRLLGLHEPLINPELIRLATSLLSRDQHDFPFQNLTTTITDIGNNKIIFPQNYRIAPTPVQDLTMPDNFQFDDFDGQLSKNPAGYWSAQINEKDSNNVHCGYYWSDQSMVDSTPSSSPAPLHGSSSTYYNSVTEDEREISYCSGMYLKYEIPQINLDVNDFI